MDSSLKNDKERGYRKELIYNLDLLKVPYSINYVTNEGKPNHIGFKGNLSVSSAYSTLIMATKVLNLLMLNY